ncbi:HD-GYP domain-containing protein [Fibrobacter sp. UWB7]|uniref:HD-GYP domain-containing protein n=1 Tax=Fibrobacter sp. UWB7 TaxID=1896206 RepID=UPI00091D73B2|nr:HD-GYP domain-containing protein [Fibrobacter sp. UWB7]SHL94563.1 HD domain-containing protein [Fibrobacter sp. UWB7]
MRKYVLKLKLKLKAIWASVEGFFSRSRNILLLMLVGLLLNVIPAKLAIFFGIPLFLDCLGTVLTAMLGGYLPAVIVGFSVNAINGIAEPVAMYYGVLSVLIAMLATFLFRRGFFKTIWKLLIVILLFALIGGGIGSIFTYALYGFNFGEGISAPFAIAFHDVLHWSRFYSQFVADIVIDIFDKSAIVLLSALIFRFIPKNIKDELKDVQLFHHKGPEKVFSSKKKSLLNKVVIMVIIAEVLLGGLASMIGFYLYRDNCVNNFVSIARGVTEAASIAIDAEKVDNYIAQGYDVDGYAHTRDVLGGIRESFPQTKYVYVYKILPDGCHVVFDLDTDGVPGGAPGSLVEFDPSFEPYLPKLLAGEEIEPIISDDQFGWLLTVYRPIKNAAGKTVAYVAADISMESIVRDEAVFFIKLLSLFFGLSLIIMMVIIEVMKHGFVVPVNKMSYAAMKISGATMRANYALDMGDNLDLSNMRKAVNDVASLGINAKDEIGHLYESLYTMAETAFDLIKNVHEQSENIQEQNKRIQRMQEVLIMEFAEMVEARDKNTGDHIKKTAEYVEAIAQELKSEGKFKAELTDGYVRKLKQAAPLHDIGKIAVSDLILNKNGKLTDEEFAIMKSHTTEGGKILQKIVDDGKDAFDADYLTESIEMASYHHEKWDGSGYPNHLKGEKIPLSARIMAVADVFDALIAERVYKKGFPYEKAMAIITEGAGKHFDPVVVEAFTHISRSLYDARTRVTPDAGENAEKAASGAVAENATENAAPGA